MAARETWVVFARKEYAEALTQVGTLELEPGQAVAERARQEYGEQWLELVAIPEKRISWAIREE